MKNSATNTWSLGPFKENLIAFNPYFTTALSCLSITSETVRGRQFCGRSYAIPQFKSSYLGWLSAGPEVWTPPSLSACQHSILSWNHPYMLSQKSRLWSAADLPIVYTQRNLDKMEALFVTQMESCCIFIAAQKYLFFTFIYLFITFILILLMCALVLYINKMLIIMCCVSFFML